jgi:hypothetical protein
MSNYAQNIWKPLKHTIIRDKSLQTTVHHNGFEIRQLLDADTLSKLEHIYTAHHKIDAKKGGMFYSIYSENIAYRKEIFDSVNEVMNPILDTQFKDYKVVVYSFVVKLPGQESEFYIHQDTTGLDEWKESPLSLWIPLQNVSEKNGCLGIIPHSHAFFSPYRSISFPAPFDAIQSTVKRYLRPVEMNRGDVLIFDNRIVHHSYANDSDQPRVALICGLFPKDAPIITCHKPSYIYGGEMELIQHEDDYLLTGKNFLIDCQKRPTSGKSIGWINDPYEEISIEAFEQLCEQYGISPIHSNVQSAKPILCNMIGEPNFIETDETLPSRTNFLHRIISKFSLNEK